METANSSIVELANKLVLHSPNLHVIPDNDDYPWFIRRFQLQLQQQEARGDLLLPNLHLENESIAIFSDYGGDHKDSPYLVYSFLICAGDLLKPFEQAMQVIRTKHGLNVPIREIQFKRMNSGPIQRAIPEYLVHLSNLVNGLLLTVVVEKNIPSLFGSEKKTTEKFIADAFAEEELGEWIPFVAEKMLRVTHFICYLVALLSKENQRVFWMTDDDAIAPSAQRHQLMLKLFSRLLNHYCKHPIKQIVGATPFAEKSPFFLDLLSATDVIAGSVEHYLSREKKGDRDTVGKESVVHTLRWLCGQGISLKRYVIRISEKDGIVDSRTLKFDLKEPDPNAVVAPVLIKKK
jgi:hypothetical protein